MPPADRKPSGRGAWFFLGGLSIVVAMLWLFPLGWYRADASAGGRFVWFAEQTVLPGFVYTNVPVGEAAEAVLVADKIVNGTFSREGGQFQVYSAKRFLNKENEIGLFSHTPDRCWTAAGWSMEPVERDFLESEVHGVKMLLERRIFSASGRRELVYFGALVGGKALPYRIDQYRAAGSKRKAGGGDDAGTWGRLVQSRLWTWAWESFVNRTPLSGPQQFIRISTSISGGDEAAADKRLLSFLGTWLVPGDYQSEKASLSEAGNGKGRKRK